MRALLIVAVLLASCQEAGSRAPAPVVPVAPPPAAVLTEGTFTYEGTYLPDDARYLHAYVDHEGHRVLVRSTDREPSEQERVARIQYRNSGSRIERLRSTDGRERTELAVRGEAAAHVAIPIETAELRLVGTYLTVCMNVDQWASVYESADGSVRLVVRRIGLALRDPLVRMRFRRLPPHEVHFPAFACMGDREVRFVVSAIPADAMP